LVLVGAFRVKGREEPLEIFTAAGDEAESWKVGLAALQSGDDAGAREAWKKSGQLLSGPVLFYERWLEARGGTLPADWDGVVRLDVK
jgi:hypothetical protein